MPESKLPKEQILNDTKQFRADVLKGFNNNPKTSQSKYFYDVIGDGLFQQIMAMPEYYLTRSEMDIFKNRTQDLANILMADGTAFDLIELGAGDATKSLFLLKHLLNRQANFTYMPIDISGHILDVLDDKLSVEMPELNIVCLEGDYFDMLKRAANLSSRRKVVMFLGGNVGNMEAAEAVSFCRELRMNLSPGDIALIGFDLKKNPQTILDAYNDKAGITAAFNLNLLTRINRELGADFNVSNFSHYQNYDPLTGACRSYIISLKEQDVSIDGTIIHFDKDEAVYMEVSQKFSQDDIEQLAATSGFAIAGSVTDSKGWFTDSLWVANN
ncbi:L-histidine N(alpha)-methyltransferase [Flavobacterium zepuense]|uniref:L-histidine N(Alpha)-methyltransferase n=1 Tax=Flavobacterium zepuense TaxID=2593302 RepID=A0A552VAL2_9FLAO|nr:L-histidine N(alpha)-methyltransferase [Flavobacterium zepuense]TRW27527.1 L-histidine N(alpha)-methyltransferase [Flavobacterium zepuense]